MSKAFTYLSQSTVKTDPNQQMFDFNLISMQIDLSKKIFFFLPPLATFFYHGKTFN